MTSALAWWTVPPSLGPPPDDFSRDLCSAVVDEMAQHVMSIGNVDPQHGEPPAKARKKDGREPADDPRRAAADRHRTQVLMAPNRNHPANNKKGRKDRTGGALPLKKKANGKYETT